MTSVTIDDPRHAMNQKKLFGHPVGLYILFMTELWERFSYYGMRALFVLFLTASISAGNPGFGWDSKQALALYGWYTMLVYVASIPGGILADKIFGQKKMVIIGGVLLCLGHGILAVEGLWAWYTGITLIILGVGGLKPNISTMVGGLYKQRDEKRDIGFTIFYIGINIGAFLAGLIIGPLGENVNWHYGFGLAGAGMVVGQILFIWGTKFLHGVGEIEKKENGKSIGKELADYFKNLIGNPIAVILNLAGIAFGAYLIYTGNLGYGLLTIGVSFFIGFFVLMLFELDGVDRDRVVVLLLSFLIVIVFWGAFEQAGGLMNLYAKQKTDRLISIFNLDLIFGISIAGLAIRGFLAKGGKTATWAYWLYGSGFLLTVFVLLRFLVFTKGEDSPEGFYTVPATVFQSVNSFFIFTLGTMVAFFWYNRKTKGKEGSSLFKMAVGVIVMGLGFSFMSLATKQWEATGASQMYWLVLAYMFHTIGELCASPVAMSFITKLAPAKYVSIMMGFYFAATGFGNKLAGALGELSTEAGEFEVFTGITIFCVIFGGLVLLLLKPLKRLTHNAEDFQPVAS